MKNYSPRWLEDSIKQFKELRGYLNNTRTCNDERTSELIAKLNKTAERTKKILSDKGKPFHKYAVNNRVQACTWIVEDNHKKVGTIVKAEFGKYDIKLDKLDDKTGQKMWENVEEH